MSGFKCHPICKGRAGGKALVSKDDICFYLADPETGRVIEKGHSLEGQSVAGKVVIFPTGKGSSVVQADGLYQLMKKGNAPAAFIIQRPDTVLVATAIIMEVPMVDRVDPRFYEVVANGDTITVDAENGLITLAGQDSGNDELATGNSSVSKGGCNKCKGRSGPRGGVN